MNRHVDSVSPRAQPRFGREVVEARVEPSGAAGVHALERVCTSEQTVGLRTCNDRGTPRKDPIVGDNPMFFIVGLVVALVVVVVLPRMLVRDGANDLGWMSQQWLAEQRASPAW